MSNIKIRDRGAEVMHTCAPCARNDTHGSAHAMTRTALRTQHITTQQQQEGEDTEGEERPASAP